MIKFELMKFEFKEWNRFDVDKRSQRKYFAENSWFSVEGRAAEPQTSRLAPR